MAQDDSVRGNGTSSSHLDILTPGCAENPSSESSVVKFYGNLNFESLGGAGFASQRTVDDWPELDVSAYDELVLEIPYTDGKKYTLNLKDTVPPAGTNDRATVSWGYDFQLPATVQGASSNAEVQRAAVLLKDLVPTFNGRVVNDSAPLNTTGIKRVSIMIRRLVDVSTGGYMSRLLTLVCA